MGIKLNEKQIREHKNLIINLGGPSRVAKLLRQRLEIDISITAVSMWQKRGIPADYRTCLAVAAKELNLPIPTRFFDPGRLPPPKVDEVPFL